MEHLKPGLAAVAFVSVLALFSPVVRGQEAQVAPALPPQAAVSAPATVETPAPAPSPLLGPPPPAPPAPAPPAPPPAGNPVSYAPVLVQDGTRRARHSEYDGPPLLLGRRAAIGGYGGFSAAYTRMLDRDGALLGFEGALLIAHKLSFGLAGYGFSRDPAGPPAVDGGSREFGVGYGGFVVRYAPFTNLPVYPSLGMLVGGGAVVLHRDFDAYDHREDDDWDDDGGQADGFFVAQPELTVHANLTRWMRLGLTAGYRITSSVHRFGLQERDLNGVVLGGTMQFGWI